LFGGYEGIVASAGLDGLASSHRLGGADPLGIVRRRIRQKSWVYVFAATPEVAVAVLMLNGAFVGTGFLMATDLRTGEVIADSSRKFALASVNDAPGDGLRASYRLPGTRYAVRRDGDDLRVHASLGRAIASLPGKSQPWMELDLILHEEGTGITAISEVEHGDDSSVSVTAKTSGMQVTGQFVVHAEGGSTTYSLDGGFGGYDYTKGILPRNTIWRWAYGTGRLDEGTVLGFTIVDGFSGVGERSRENAVWIDGQPTALDARTHFEFDPGDVMKPWRITTADGTVRLRFDPVAAHNEYLDVRAVRSLFIQPMGHFSGEIDVAGRTYVIDRMPGVAEDNDILW
jgi:Domain of unknown function (DUF2804), C-terminal/Domain of unknown function (DUF2804), N-terminal